MGLAASQARYLALTARRSDLEYQSQTINSRRIQLSYKTAEIAREYSDGMNNTRIKIAKAQTGTDGKTTNVWEELTFSNMLSQGYMIIGSEGTPLDSPLYTPEGYTQKINCRFATEGAFTDKTTYKSSITYDEFKSLSPSAIQSFYQGVGTKVEASGTEGETGYIPEHYTNYTIISAFDETDATQYSTLTGLLDTWAAYTDTSGDKKTLKDFAELYKTGSRTETSYKLNSNYTGSDIQSLLVSGKGQIVTKEFYNFLVQNGYTQQYGLIGDKSFYELMEEFENSKEYNSAGRKSVIDWRSDETDTFESRSYTEDDEKVLAKYEADTAKIQALDKQLEMEEKNIETQHKAIETELENLKKVIQKNIEDTFKIFS